MKIADADDLSAVIEAVPMTAVSGDDQGDAAESLHIMGLAQSGDQFRQKRQERAWRRRKRRRRG